jgi:imidazolonepropionase-like amidohydrolase
MGSASLIPFKQTFIEPQVNSPRKYAGATLHRMRIRTLGAIAAVVFTCASALMAQGSYVLKAARMFDSTNGQMVTPGMVVVSNGVIQSVGGDSTPSGATIIDLGDATLLPGFIDAHTHLSDEFNPDHNGNTLFSLQRPISEKAIRATANARKTVMAGFTTVRDLGSSDFIDIGLRNSINAGYVPGPRMLVSVHALGSTGAIVDGRDDIRRGTTRLTG